MLFKGSSRILPFSIVQRCAHKYCTPEINQKDPWDHYVDPVVAKLRSKKNKKPKGIERKLFSPDGPVSGSIIHKNMVELRNQPYKFDTHSLLSRGFLRFQKKYDPPTNVEEKLISLVTQALPKLDKCVMEDLLKYELKDGREKYDFLSLASTQFNHSVPNSLLYMIETIGDALKFYSEPINTNTPYDEICRSKDLPSNLHLQKEPLRFHPETDTMFGGVSAYPQTSLLVTGIYAKRKYKGFKANETNNKSS